MLVGLHDHHVHLAALAAEAASVRVGPAEAGDRGGLVGALRSGPPGSGCGPSATTRCRGELDRWVLDDFAPDRPVRVQHRSGRCGCGTAPRCGPPGWRAGPRGDGGDGRFWREDERLRGFTPPVRLDLRGVGARAAAYRITGFTNADPHPGQDLPGLLSVLPQRLVVMGIGDAPVKFLLDDATLPTPGELAASVAAVRPRPVAVHCVTRVQLLVTLLALDEAGPVAGDRIEHGSVIPAETLPWLARLGVTVVTQPHFPVERGREYATDVDPDDQAHLYRCRSLAEAGSRSPPGPTRRTGVPTPGR
ncbi:amidohydrolase [Streptomyces mirabilis]|nr:amidohydrolase [Streptomyces mirabilis]